jgi:hypothetical protein
VQLLREVLEIQNQEKSTCPEVQSSTTVNASIEVMFLGIIPQHIWISQVHLFYLIVLPKVKGLKFLLLLPFPQES